MRSDELQHLREENRSKTEVKEVLPYKENTFTESSRKHSFKGKKRFGNQKIIWYYNGITKPL